MTTATESRIAGATVIANRRICRDHYRATFRLDAFGAARPGQFVQLSPPAEFDRATIIDSDECKSINGADDTAQADAIPFLPRAYSIADVRRAARHVDVDVIFRVVGLGTRWLRTLRPGHAVTMLGPLGKPFPIDEKRRHAYLVIGGVGLPPLLWLAEELNAAGKNVTAFCGAQSAELIPLQLSDAIPPDREGRVAVACATEFAEHNVNTVISTDDGACGFHGHVVQALQVYREANPIPADDVVVYTCGPERMMRAAAEFCAASGITCYVSMERPMACGVGTCQSCIITVRDEERSSGRRYALCCTEGPVFDARDVLWDTP